MNLLAISVRNVRQRMVGSSLTLLSVALGSALVASLWLMIDQTNKRYTASTAGFDAVVGPKAGDPLSLVLSTVLNLGEGTGLLPMSVYHELREGRLARRYGVRYAIPQARGDTFGGFPLVGTTDEMFTVFARGKDEDGNPRRLELAEGEFWTFGHEPFVKFVKERSDRIRYIAEHGEPPSAGHSHADGENHDHEHSHEDGGHAHGNNEIPAAWRKAVIGAVVAEKLNLGIGGEIVPVHGEDPRTAHTHEEARTEVVGVLKKTGTPLDRVIWMPISAFLSMEGHEPLVTPDTDLSEDQMQLTGIVVSTKHRLGGEWLRTEYQSRRDAQAAVPRQQIIRLLSMLGSAVDVLRVVAWLVIIVAAIGVLVALYNTMNERRREIAIMRSLGASRDQIIRIIVQEALLVSFLGGLLGVALCHAAAFAFAGMIAERTGVGIEWDTFSLNEVWLILGVTAIGGAAGALPAIKGATVEVAENLGPVS